MYADNKHLDEAATAQGGGQPQASGAAGAPLAHHSPQLLLKACDAARPVTPAPGPEKLAMLSIFEQRSVVHPPQAQQGWAGPSAMHVQQRTHLPRAQMMLLSSCSLNARGPSCATREHSADSVVWSWCSRLANAHLHTHAEPAGRRQENTHIGGWGLQGSCTRTCCVRKWPCMPRHSAGRLCPRT